LNRKHRTERRSSGYAALLIALGLVGLPAMGWAASFDCRRASAQAEKIVCADRELSALDEKLARAYKRFISVSPQPYADQRSQTHWVATRDACMDRVCLADAYKARLAELRSQSTEWYIPAPGGDTQVAVSTPPPVCAALRTELEFRGRAALSNRGPRYRYHEVDYSFDIGDQEVSVYQENQADVRLPVCSFKRRWTEAEKRAAYAVLKRYPDLLKQAILLRPEKEVTSQRKQVWNVQFRCQQGSVHAAFNVEPRTLRVRPVISPGGEGSSRCEPQQVALTDTASPAGAAGHDWIGLP
jgi:uncharacterized protein